MPDSQTTPQAAVTPPEKPPWRLTIRDLLFLTTAMAVGLGLHLGYGHLQEAPRGVGEYLFYLAYAELSALAIMGSLMFGYRMVWAARPFRPSPGHWLLVLCAIDWIATTGAEWLASRMMNIQYFLWGLMWGVGIAMVCTVIVAIFFVRPAIWKAYLFLRATLAAGTVLGATPALFLYVYPWGYVAISGVECLSSFALAGYALRRRQLFHDRLQALGIAIVCGRSTLALISWVSVTPYW